MLTLKKFYFVYVICMHMISQPLYIVCPSEMWTFVRDAGVQKLPIASFHVYITRLWNSVPAYCFPLSYHLHLFKGNVSVHLAFLSITWKTANKNIGSFYLTSKLINWFEKRCPVFDTSHIIWSHTHCNCIYFGT